MAEVFGQLGDQPIELNNAATEITLNKLLLINTQMAAKLGIKTDRDIKQIKKTDAELKKLAKATQDNYATLIKLDKARKQELKAIEDKNKSEAVQQKSQERLNKNYQLFNRHLSQTITKLTSATKTLSDMGSSLSSATQVFSLIPKIGGTLSTALGAVASAVEKTQKAFQQSASVGANFNGSFQDMITAASGAGLTFDQFSGVVQAAGRDVALLGQGSEAGAKQLAGYVKQLRTINNGDLQGQLAGLGFSAESIAENFAAYGASMARIGRLQSMSNEELIYSTADYLKNLSAVSKLTGEDRKSLEKRQQDMMNDSQFRSMMLGQEEETFNNVNLLLSGLPETTAKAVKEIAATGTAISGEAQALSIQNPELFQAAQQLHQTLQRRDKFTEAEATQIHKSTQERARVNTADMNELSGFLGRLGDTTQQQIALDQANIAAQTTTLKATKAAADAAPAETEAAKILRTQQSLAESSNEMTKSLLSYTSQLESMMKGLNFVVQEYLAPTITRFSDNLAGLAATVLGVSLLSGAVDAGASMAGGYLGGKLAAGAAGGGMAAMLKTVAAFMFGPGMAIMAGLGLAGVIWYLIKNEGPEQPSVFGSASDKAVQQSRQDLQSKVVDIVSQSDLYTKEQVEAAKQAMNDTRFNMASRWEESIRRAQETIDTEMSKDEGNRDQELIDSAKKTIDRVAEHLKPLQSTIDIINNALPSAAVSGGITPSLPLGKALDMEGGVADGLLEATEELVEATKANTKETKNASSCDLDYSSPQALFNSFAKLMIGGGPGNQPGTTMSSRVLGTTTGEDEMFSSVGSSNLQNYLKTVAMIESSGDPSAKAKTSSASGMFQFTDRTWKETVKAMDKDYTADDRFDPKKATEVMEFFTQRQKAQLEKSTGKAASDVDMYMAHFLGAAGAGKFLNAMSASPDASAAETVGPRAASANKSIFYKNDQARSLQEVYNLMASKYQKHEASVLTGNIPAVVASVSKHMAPSGPQAVAAMTPEKENSSVVNTTAQTGDGQTTTSQSSPGAPGTAAATISSLTDQLETLNSSVGQLVAYTEASLKLTEKHITATRSLSNDQFTS